MQKLTTRLGEMMSRISADLRAAAIEAFHAYEEVSIARVVRREGWRMDASPVGRVLASDDPELVLKFIDDMQKGREGLLNTVFVN